MIVILHQRTHPKRLEDLAQDHPGSNLRSDTLNPVLLFFQRGCLSMLPLHLKRLWLLGCLSSVHWKPILESLESYVTFNPWSHSVQSVQSLSHVQFFATPWTVALQASLSITNSWSFIYPEEVLKGQQSNKINNIKDVLKRELPIQSNRRNSKEWSIPLNEIILLLLDQHIFFVQHFLLNECHHLPQGIIIGIYILCERNV